MKLILTSPSLITLKTDKPERVILAEEDGTIVAEYSVPAHHKLLLTFDIIK